MAHEIDMTTGRAACAYLETSGTPWHGLGTPMSVDATHAQWAVGSGLDLVLGFADVRYVAPDGAERVMRDRRVIYRADTGEGLAVVSDQYKLVQPAQCLDLFRETADSQGWDLETAGVLRGGRQFWAMARTPIGDRENSLYTLMSTSADGSLATSVTGTAVRVVCANTLGQALRGEKGREIKIRHNTTFNARQIQKELGMVDLDATWGSFQELMDGLKSTPVSSTEATAIFSELLRPGSIGERQVRDLQADDFSALLGAPRRATSLPGISQTDKGAGRAIRGLEALETSYMSAPGACPGTGYGVLQGVTHYLDHVRGGDDRRASAWFGQGAALKDRAVELIQSEVWRDTSMPV